MKHLGLAALVLAAAACPAKPAARPKLSVFEVAPGEPAPAGALAPEAFSVALGALSPEPRARLLEALTQATDAEVKRAHPLVVDLVEDGTPERARLRELLRADVPAVTAANNLLGAPWHAPGLQVELGTECAPHAARCFEVPSPAREDTLERRGAFAAWALAHAALVRSPTKDALVEALRAEQQQPGSALALVLSARSGSVAAGQRDAFERQARRGIPLLPEDAPERRWLEALAHAPAGWSLPVPLEADEVLVIPRLASLARLHEFAAEIERAGPLEWVVRPAP